LITREKTINERKGNKRKTVVDTRKGGRTRSRGRSEKRSDAFLGFEEKSHEFGAPKLSWWLEPLTQSPLRTRLRSRGQKKYWGQLGRGWLKLATVMVKFGLKERATRISGRTGKQHQAGVTGVSGYKEEKRPGRTVDLVKPQKTRHRRWCREDKGENLNQAKFDGVIQRFNF